MIMQATHVSSDYGPPTGCRHPASKGWRARPMGQAAGDHTWRMSRYTVLVQRLGAQRWFAAVARRLVPLDRRMYLLTQGRWSPIGKHGLPSLLITTIGRRSGLPRTQPLLYTADGDAYVVVGSNWGQAHHPAWSANLLAHPTARVTLGDREFGVHATLASGAERERLWRLVQRVWPGYAAYARRAEGRQIRIFRLTPAEEG
jgi:deazaflavin-dependent oxidoreductase (nitroreductase family)